MAMKRRSITSAAVAAGLALGLMGAAPVAALASNGVQSGTQSFNSQDSSWSGGSGKITLTYDTKGGTWSDPGPSESDDKDNTTYQNGTYVVTIPASISYAGMSAGTVSTEDSYSVTVRGAIDSDKSVLLKAETNQKLASGTLTDDITEETTQGKTKWTADECFGSLNSDGSLSGTSVTDTIKLSGTAKGRGGYQGTVGYTASVS